MADSDGEAEPCSYEAEAAAIIRRYAREIDGIRQTVMPRELMEAVICAVRDAQRAALAAMRERRRWRRPTRSDRGGAASIRSSSAVECAGCIGLAQQTLSRDHVPAVVAALKQAKREAVKFVRDSAASEIKGRQKSVRMKSRSYCGCNTLLQMALLFFSKPS